MSLKYAATVRIATARTATPTKDPTHMEFCYPYPRMLVTVDAVILLKHPGSLLPHVLLVERRNDPYRGHYALPGGFPGMDERLADAAKRELHEEAGLAGVELELLGVFDSIGRDPRGRNIAVAFWGSTTEENARIAAGDDAEKAAWFPLGTLPPLAFDHSEIIRVAKEKLCRLP